MHREVSLNSKLLYLKGNHTWVDLERRAALDISADSTLDWRLTGLYWMDEGWFLGLMVEQIVVNVADHLLLVLRNKMLLLFCLH